MLSVISGEFHPTLEKAFLEKIKGLKQDPLTPILIIAPSSKMMERLQWIIGQANLSFLNLHFHTFTSLAQILVDNAGGLSKPILSDPLFYDTLVKFIVKEDRPFQGFSDLAVPQGFPPQVRGTIRDLVDAGLPADGPVILDAVKEDFLGKNVDLGWLLQLLRFYQIYSDRLTKFPVLSRSAVVKEATQQAPNSSFLKSFKEILYYGFYDLTGLQRDFFESVVKNHPSTFFFPHVHEHTAFSFSSRFREAILMSLTDKETRLDEGKTDKSFEVGHDKTEIWNTSGLRDEAWRVAGEILKMHENGVAYSDIGIVARSQERLKDVLPAVLTERHIPFRTAVKESLAKSPQIEMALQFLKSTDPKEAAVLSKDFLSNPDFKADKEPFSIAGSLPDSTAWSVYVQKCKALFQKHFSPSNPESKKVWNLMISGLEALSQFDLLKSKVSRKEFLETLTERWMNLEYNSFEQTEAGVSLYYAESARGLSFKVLFLLGVEERVFPRVIREDPFLRDDARFELFNTLGYKINQKLVALEEERLLFHLLLKSAEEKLFITYQRSDEDGSVVGPSGFLRAFAEDNNLSLDDVVKTIPRPTQAKLKEVTPSQLGSREIVIRYLANQQTKEALAFSKNIGKNEKTLDHSLKMTNELAKFGNPSPYDGALPKQSWDTLFPDRPVSPTRLEIYGRCPFQFFATQLLGLQPLDEELTGLALPLDKKGTLVHTFFEDFYQQYDFKEKGFPAPLFNQVFKKVFGSVKAQEMEVHPLLWDVHLSLIKRDIKDFLEADLSSIRETGFKPTYFEASIATKLDAPLDQVRWYGQPDRIDINNEGDARILDYKTGRISDRPVLASLRGLKIQPSVYILLVEKFLKSKKVPAKQISFVYEKLGVGAGTSELTYQDWLTHKDQIVHTIQTQLDLMQKGHFLIYPDDSYCNWCDVQEICRKNHGPSLSRSQQGTGATMIKIRTKKAR